MPGLRNEFTSKTDAAGLAGIAMDNLAKRNNASEAIEGSSQRRLRSGMAITRWLDAATQLKRLELPTQEVTELWYELLDGYPEASIDYAFRDYLADGTDDNGKVEFFEPSAIGRRCREWCSLREGKTRDSETDELYRLRLDREAHPEKYVDQRELQEFLRDATARFAGRAVTTDAEWEARRKKAREDADKLQRKESA